MKTFLTTLILMLSSSVAADQNNIRRGASSAELLPWIKSYSQIDEKAISSGNQQALFKLVQISFECTRVAQRDEFLSNSGLTIVEPTGHDIPVNAKSKKTSDEIRDRIMQNASTEAVVVTEACQEAGVASSEQGFEWLISLADSGYTPALMYFVRTIPPVYQVTDPSDYDEYQTLKQTYLNQAFLNGSGEAMFILASSVRTPAYTNSPASYEEALEGYSLASAALKCGYRHSNVNELLEYINDRYELDDNRARARTKEIVSEFCKNGGG